MWVVRGVGKASIFEVETGAPDPEKKTEPQT